ncbi:MAG: fliF [Caulobacter sp.]|nr:fliF [Caulobacter sp.]
MEQFFGALRRFGLGRLAALLGVGAGVAAALVAVTLNLGAQPQALLYSNLDLKEASSITAALDQAGVKYEAKGDGSTIMVARDKVASTRLMLSGKGLPTSASVGYEIFDTTNSLGQTDFVQQLNRQRAVEGELARTIHSLDGVSFVRVHLVLPKRQLFEEQADQPSASVTMGVGGRIPSADMVQAVQNLVAGAVPNLKAERVTVIDQHGKTLSAGSDGSMAGKIADDRKSEVETRIEAQVKNLVEGVVGPGKVRVDVTADIDQSQVTVQEEKYDPDGQVVVSEQTTGENEKQNQPDGASAVSVGGNLPGATPVTGANNTSATDRNASTTNYANSKSVRTEVQSPGAIKKISVAVAVDGVTAPAGKDGKPGPYRARTAEEMSRIDALVKAAVGYDESRKDVVQVINVPFPHDADADGVTAAGPLSGFDKNDVMRAVELGVLGIVAILILMFAVRPVLRGVMGGGTGLPLLGGHLSPSMTRTVVGPGGQPLQVTIDGNTGESLALPPPEIDSRIDIARIEGQVKASSIKRVSEFVDRHPEESVSILRSWLHESA